VLILTAKSGTQGGRILSASGIRGETGLLGPDNLDSALTFFQVAAWIKLDHHSIFNEAIFCFSSI
jgi:hypothetical protein